LSHFFSLHLRLAWRGESARFFRALLGKGGSYAAPSVTLPMFLGPKGMEETPEGQALTAGEVPPTKQLFEAAPSHLQELAFTRGEIRYYHNLKEALRALEAARKGMEGHPTEAAAAGSGGPYRGFSPAGGFHLLDLVVAGQVILRLAGYLSTGTAPPISRDKLAWLFAALQAFPPRALSSCWSFSPKDMQASLTADEIGRLAPGLTAL
jgi:hypothetical protein